MGYFVTISKADCKISKDNTEAALAVVKAMNTDPELEEVKRGGSWGPNGKTERWFSWMPASFEHYTTLFEFLTDLGFDTLEVDGDITITGYDNKTGQEDLFLAHLAPFIEAGSFIEWRGEDGATWRNRFDGTTMLTDTGKVVYF